jgi:uncharacterized membrane protein
MRSKDETNIPPGWSQNPASWSQRLPIVGLALVGMGIAGYLALYQYEVIPSVWEPFFADGSAVILNSPLSRILTISDGALGAFAYFLDAAAGLIGGDKRWRSMPWIVIVFGVLIGPLGAVSIGLVIAQPVLYQSWCTLCLLTAFISLCMVGPAMDEVLASIQFLRRVKRNAPERFWDAFFGKYDDSMINGGIGEMDKRTNRKAGIYWPGIINTFLGVWIMISPAVFGYGMSASANDHIIGPLAVSFAFISLWEVLRSCRLVNIVFGIWMLLAAFLLPYPQAAIVNNALTGTALIIFSLPKGRIKNSYGGGWGGS